MAASLAFLVAAVPEVPAQEEATSAALAEHRFDIPAQGLGEALAQFSQQSGLQVSVHGDLVRGIDTAGVNGTMTSQAALARLLDGKGLHFGIGPEGAVIVEEPLGPESSATLLAPIAVEAALETDARAGSADQADAIVIDRADLELIDPATMKEVFAGESSVSVGGGLPMNQKIYVNGVEETNLAVSIDGGRQNNKIFHHAGNTLIDPSLLKAVRVDPGVAPADAGPGALAGSIVYETVDAGDLLAPDRTVGAFASSSYTTNGETFTESASAFGRMEGFEILGYAQFANGSNYNDGHGTEVPGSGSDLTSLLGKAAYESDEGYRVEFIAENVHDDASRPFRANIGNIITRNDPAVREYNLERQNYVVNFEDTAAQGLWDPRLVIGYGVTELAVPSPFDSTGHTGSLSGKIENDFHLGDGDTLTVGFDAFDDFARYEDPTTDVRETATNLGVFVQARITPLDALRLSFGLRGDQQWFEGVEGTQIQDAGASGNLSAAYDVNDFLTLRAGYSNVWGGFALAENFILNPAWDYSAGLEPVRARNYTAGFEVAHQGFTFDAGVFRTKFDNARDPNFRGGPSIVSDFRTEGYDLGAGYAWDTGFARLTFTDSKINVNGLAADSDVTQYFGAPLGRVIAAEAAQRFDAIGLTIGGTVDAALENTSTVDAGGQPLPSYQVYNLFGEWKPTDLDFLTLRVEANNIFDEAYADRATYGQDFATVLPLMEPGRSFVFKLRANF